MLHSLDQALTKHYYFSIREICFPPGWYAHGHINRIERRKKEIPAELCDVCIYITLPRRGLKRQIANISRHQEEWWDCSQQQQHTAEQEPELPQAADSTTACMGSL